METQHEDFHRTDYNYFYGFFIFCFVGLSMANAYFLKKNSDITIKITNGTLLLQLLAILYLSLHLGLIGSTDFRSFFLGIGVATFAILIATSIFSKREISAPHQLFLSIFSSIISLIFSISYLRCIINLDLGLESDFSHKLGICAQLFLFGVSLVYNAENVWLLLRFMPGRGERRSNYRLRLRNLKAEHIARFQNFPLPISQILACIIIVGSYFYLNAFFHWAPPLAAVWAIFLIYPLIAALISRIFKLNDRKPIY